MPELPEVEFTRRLLQRRVAGRRILRARCVDPRLLRGGTADLAGRRVGRFDRVGKFIFGRVDDGRVWVIHLGMTGHVCYREPPDHAHARVDYEGGTFWFRDPRRFGRFQVLEGEPDLGLGPDALAATAGDLRFESRQAIKVALLDQSRIAGVGNIQAAEALFAARIDPRRRAGSLTPAERRRLLGAIQRSMRRTLGMIRTEELIYVSEGGANPFLVYDRAGEPCARCATPLRRLVQARRSTVFCPACQR
jgi:formamidopyrimidine-DNA glycosylase